MKTVIFLLACILHLVLLNQLCSQSFLVTQYLLRGEFLRVSEEIVLLSYTVMTLTFVLLLKQVFLFL